MGPPRGRESAAGLQGSRELPLSEANSRATAPVRFSRPRPPTFMALRHARLASMARMVDISKKPDVPRRAVATGEILLSPATLRAIRAGKVEKGDPVRTAEIAPLQAVKRGWEALPHAHPIPTTSAAAEFRLQRDRIAVSCEVSATYKTGVEMEALYGVTVALLTIWDMVKSLEKDAAGQYPATRIQDVRVVSKEKGPARRPR